MHVFKALTVVLTFILYFSVAVSAQDRLCDTAFEDCRTPLWSLIDHENVGIDVAFWFMQDQSISNKIIARFQAGVPVRVIIDPRANPSYAGNQQILDQIQAAGIPMRYKIGDGILHWKMILFAGQNQVEFSGANYSPSFFVPTTPYVNYIDEAIYFTDDPSLIQSFKTKYDDLWTDTTLYANYANVTGPLTRKYPISPIDPELNYPPSIDDSQDFFNRTQLAFNQETQKIDVVMYRITNQRYTDMTLDAVRRGIPVRLIHEPNEYRNVARQWDAWNVDRMYMGGVQIKMRKHEGLNHQKSVVLYNQGLTIFGSSNWTGPSTNYQQEHNYFTHKPYFLQWFVDQFERKWNSGAENQPFVPLPPDQASYIAPSNAAIAQPTTVKLQWEGGPWAHKYDIYFGTTPNPPLYMADVGTLQSGAVAGQPLLDSGSVDSGVSESFTIPATLQSATTYYWRIVSKTMANQTAGGQTWSFTTAGSQTPPSAPTTLTANAASSSQINLSWSDVSTESGYRVERSADGVSNWAEIANLGANTISYSDQSVSPQHTYYYRVRAFNPGGFSPYTSAVNATTPAPPQPSGSDVVLWAGEASVKIGNWSIVADSTAAGGNRIWNPDAAVPKIVNPAANPTNYFELTFNAQGGVDYRLWMRGKAQSDFWGNDSVFIQFSDSVDNTGAPVFRIGTSDATTYNLEDCSGCGIQGWGWQDNGWGVGVLGPLIRFQSTGAHTLRVQVREDGLSLDQIVLSPQTYLNVGPGPLRNDTTILPKSAGGTSTPPTITSLNPNTGSTSGGTSVSISGSGFVNGANVSFGGTPATNVTFVSSTNISALTPAHAEGTVSVIVTNPDTLSATLANSFTYVAVVPPPQVASVSPNSGPTSGGTAITITGSGFGIGANVAVGGTQATSISVQNSTTITAVTPSHTAGQVNVTVTNDDDQSGSLVNGFTYVTPTPVPQFGHVFLVVDENQSYESVIGNSAMPYINRLAARYGLATNYFANTHPSIGNYFWLTTGQGITNDSNFTGPVTADNIVRHLLTDGKTWRSYAESLPSVGYTGTDQYPYVKRHNPFAYFSDVIGTAQANNLVPFSQFATDLSANQLPNFSFIIPNQYNNAHDCPQAIPSCNNTDKLAAADAWLKTNLDPLLASATFRQDGLLIILFDESVDTDVANGGGHAAMLVISSKSNQAFQSSSFFQHQSTLRTVSEAVGLSSYSGAAATAPSMAEFFGAIPNTAPVVTGVSPTSGSTLGGDQVTITGTGFATGATVAFGGTPANGVTINGSTTITASAPPHAAGLVTVAVTNPNGQTGSKSGAYSYVAPTGETVLLADDFNNASLDTTKWVSNNLFSGFTDSSITIQETQSLDIGPLKQNIDGSHYNGIRSGAFYNFTGAYCYVQLAQAPSSSTAADAFFTIGLNVDNNYRVYVEGGTLFLQKKIGGAKTNLMSIPFNAVNHAFWRIRHDSAQGKVVFETAPSNAGVPGTWTQIYSEQWNTSAVPLSSVMFEIKGGTWKIESSAPGSVKFDNFKAAKP
ncbi:MAG: IPT/TIG domain-containing protein [Pyrinomonadaceae bacterium]